MHCTSNICGALTVLAVGAALSGCTSIDFEGAQWFAKPLDLTGRQGGYTYSELRETAQKRPITPNELVGQNGTCPPPPAAAMEQPNPAANNPGTMPAVATDADTLLGAGVALGMSECDVVYRAGAPSSVQLGQNPNGDRTAVLTFDSGPRAGIYRFERGRLAEMDRVAQAPPPEPSPKTARKKRAKPNSQQSKNDQT